MISPAASANRTQDIYAKARFNMVEAQIRTNRVTDERILAAMSELPRQVFVPPSMASVAYVDKSIRITSDRYLAEPLVLARLLQEAQVDSADKALIVGAGTGYSAAVLANLAASVVALESDPELAANAAATLADLGLGNVVVQSGPLPNGWAQAAPYDVILIDGMIDTLPVAISAQLADHGRLVAVQSQEGRCGAGMLYRKLGGAVSGRVLFDAVGPLLPGFAPEPTFSF